METGQDLRIAIYSQDGFGLGHMQRTGFDCLGNLPSSLGSFDPHVFRLASWVSSFPFHPIMTM